MQKKSTSYEMDMLSGSLWQKLIFFAIPLTLTSILQQLFNSADTAVVGRFVSSEAQAAVGANSSVINLIVTSFVGMSVGANVVIAGLIAQKREQEISEAVHTVIAFSLLASLGILVLGELLAVPILRLMSTPEDVIDLAVRYLRIYFLGVPFEMLYNFGAAILRSRGDSKRPLYSLLFSGLINVVLNLFFVVLLHRSVDGVAVATVVSNIIASLCVVRFLCTSEAPYTLDFRKLRIHRKHLRRIILIGAPAGMQSAVFSISNVTVQSAINAFGSAAVAGASIALYFDMFSFYFCDGFSQACVTFTSQNAAAGREDRCRRIFCLCTVFGVLFSLAVSLSFYGGQSFLLGLYSSDAMVLHFASVKLGITCITQFLETFFVVPGSALRGHGHSMVPMVLTVLGTCVYRLGWVFLFFPQMHDFSALMTVYPVSWFLTSVMMLLAYFKMEQQLKKRASRVA